MQTKTSTAEKFNTNENRTFFVKFLVYFIRPTWCPWQSYFQKYAKARERERDRAIVNLLNLGLNPNAKVYP